MRSKQKVAALVCLVCLAIALPVFGACASKSKTISDLRIEIEAVEPIAMAVKPYDSPKSLATEYNTFHVILGVTNPNDFLVTIGDMDIEVRVHDFSLGLLTIPGPIYVPAGKKVLVRYPNTLNSSRTNLALLTARMTTFPEALKELLQIWGEIQNGTAKYVVKGGANVKSEAGTKFQAFELRWP